MDVKISSSDDEMNKSKEKSESSEISENSKNSKDNEQIINYFPLINKNLSNLEENRQNYFNKLSDLKSKLKKLNLKMLFQKTLYCLFYQILYYYVIHIILHLQNKKKF